MFQLPYNQAAQMLTPCSSCGRHIRNTELACPFCNSANDPAQARPTSVSKIPRVAAAALVVGATLQFAGCVVKYGGPPPPNPQPVSQPASQASSKPESQPENTPDPGRDLVPAYGAPPMPEPK